MATFCPEHWLALSPCIPFSLSRERPHASPDAQVITELYTLTHAHVAGQNGVFSKRVRTQNTSRVQCVLVEGDIVGKWTRIWSKTSRVYPGTHCKIGPRSCTSLLGKRGECFDGESNRTRRLRSLVGAVGVPSSSQSPPAKTYKKVTRTSIL